MNFKKAQDQTNFGTKLVEMKDNAKKLQRVIKKLFGVDLSNPIFDKSKHASAPFGNTLVLRHSPSGERYCLYFRDSVLYIGGGADYINPERTSGKTQLKALSSLIEYELLFPN